jgi:WhiB family redox-sensing transcriptional regulator
MALPVARPGRGVAVGAMLPPGGERGRGSDRRWHVDAACRDAPSALFLAPANRMQRALALAICEVCPVRAQCLAEALQMASAVGIWGGTIEADRITAAQRRALRARITCPRDTEHFHE